jgi:hypothetical protein
LWLTIVREVVEWVSNSWENIIGAQIWRWTLQMLLQEWLESKLSWFVITVSWWRSLSLILFTVIIDILIILYVKSIYQIREHTLWTFFSSLLYNFKVIKFNYTLLGFIWLIEQKIWNLGLFAYTMTWVLRYGEIRFWDICSWEFSILVCAPFGFEFGFYLWLIK